MQIKSQLQSSAVKTGVIMQTIKSTVSIQEYGVVNGAVHLPVDPVVKGSRFRSVLSGAVTRGSWPRSWSPTWMSLKAAVAAIMSKQSRLKRYSSK